MRINLYESKLKIRSTELRNKMTFPERILWNQIRRKQIRNVQFLRQKPIGKYIVDFYAPSIKLAIEVDGAQHNDPEMILYDQNRDQYLKSLGLHVMRFENCWVEHCLDLVMVEIERYVERVLGGDLWSGTEG